MNNYYGLASVTYTRAPVGLSIMYMTLAELWVACDRCACTTYPMLAEYDPEVNLTEFQCLVLPHKGRMERLNTVESYVKSRQNRAIQSLPSVFRKFGDGSSLAVRYFNQSAYLQATLSKIEVDAAAKRKKKCEELKALKNQYKQYMDRYNTTECQYRTVIVNRHHGYTEQRHKADCGRCANKTRADALKIRIYEWPVSSIPAVAQATVFELMIPTASVVGETLQRTSSLLCLNSEKIKLGLHHLRTCSTVIRTFLVCCLHNTHSDALFCFPRSRPILLHIGNKRGRFCI
jgi:hypothetical protein